jgi:sugar phosphate isomerase/epimerase
VCTRCPSGPPDPPLREQTLNDRELLEAAAKAAGIEVTGHHPAGGLQFKKDGLDWVFDPLRRDGDAFRLAVKLNMQVTHYGDVADAGPWNEDWRQEEWTGINGSDPYAATRRAIVRAAASHISKEQA